MRPSHEREASRLPSRSLRLLPVVSALLAPAASAGDLLPRNLNLAASSQEVLPVDLDGDGLQDLVFAQGTDEHSKLWSARNLGGGAWDSPVQLAGVGGVVLLDTGDLDGDGDPEILISIGPELSNRQTLGVLENLGNGYFAAPQTLQVPAESKYPYTTTGVKIARIVDLDADGDGDLVYADHLSNLSVVENQGGLTLGPTTRISSCCWYDTFTDIHVCDLDGDGHLDLLSTQHNGALRFWRNLGGLSFSELSSLPSGYLEGRSVCSADLDGDADLDIVVSGKSYGSGGSEGISWLENLGGGALALPVKIESDLEVAPLLATDLDQDGDADLLAYGTRVISGSGGIPIGNPGLRWIENLGGGSFAPSVSLMDYEAPSSYQAPRFGRLTRLDLDGDSDLDIVHGRLWFERAATSVPGQPYCYPGNEFVPDPWGQGGCPLGSPIAFGGAPNSSLDLLQGGALVTENGSLLASGVASVSADSLQLSVGGLPAGVPGMFLEGDQRRCTPLGLGYLCLNPMRRFGLQVTSPSGTAAASGMGAYAVSGATRHYQFWFRDPSFVPFYCPDPAVSRFNFSNGWTVTWRN